MDKGGVTDQHIFSFDAMSLLLWDGDVALFTEKSTALRVYYVPFGIFLSLDNYIIL